MNVLANLLGNSNVHLEVSDTTLELGIFYQLQRMYDPAESFLRCSLSDKRRLFGNVSHVDLVEGMQSLAKLLRITNKHEEAISLFHGAIDMMKRLCVEEEHYEDVARMQYGLGNLLEKKGELDGAEVVLRECLETRRRMHGTHGVDDFKLAVTIRQLCRVLLRKDDLNDTDKLLRECLSLFERIYEHDALLIAHVLSELAIVLDRKGVKDETHATYRRCIEMFQRIDGPRRHRIVLARTLYGFGQFLEKQELLDEAEVAFTECLEMHRSLYPGVDSAAGRSITCALTRVVRGNGDLDEASKRSAPDGEAPSG